jgi:transposase
MNDFKAGKGDSSGIVEGLNLKVNLSMRKAYGYRSFDLMKVARLHQLGDLPGPKPTHRFY